MGMFSKRKSEGVSWSGEPAGGSGGGADKDCDHRGATTFHEEFLDVVDRKGNVTRKKVKHNTCQQCGKNWDS
jgi:hypothetical protein